MVLQGAAKDGRPPIGIAPALGVADDRSDRFQRVLDDIGAGERAPEFPGQAEANDAEVLVEAFQDAARHTRFVVRRAPGQGSRRAFGLVPKVLRIALVRAFAPSTMNGRDTVGSSPLPTRVSSRAGTVAAFSAASSSTARTCSSPLPRKVVP